MSLLDGLQNFGAALQSSLGTGGPTNTSTRLDPNAIAQSRSQQFLNMYANRLVNRAINASPMTFDGKTLNFEGSSSDFPKQDVAWNNYSAEARNRGIQPNYAAFSGVYAEAWKTYQQKVSSDVTGILNDSPNLSNIQKSVKNNPNLKNHLMNIKDTNPELASYIDTWLPKKSLAQNIEENPLSYKLFGGLTAGAGYGAYRGLSGIAQSDELTKAKETLKDIKDKKRYKGRASDIRKAEKAVNDATKTRYQKYFKDPKNYLGKTGALVRGGAYGLAPDLLGEGVEMATGDERLGDYAASGSRALIATQTADHFLRPVQEYVKKHGKKKFMELIMEKGGRKLALSLAAKGLFSFTGLGAIASGGLLARDLYQISQWVKEDLGYSEGANKPQTTQE
jgi:hypothetical protein